MDTNPVSIPHRYDQNSDPFQGSVLLVMFQFLIGTIKTSNYREKANVILCVSIPHRYDQNEIVTEAAKEAKNLGFNSS